MERGEGREGSWRLINCLLVWGKGYFDVDRSGSGVWEHDEMRGLKMI